MLTFTPNDFQRLEAQFSGPELVRLYDFLTRLLHRARPMEAVVTTRLPPEAVDHVTRLVVLRRRTRSDLVREAVMEYLQRNPV